MANVMKTLREINWKRHINTFIKVFSDFKNLGLLALMIFTLYGIGWDTVLRPNLQQLQDKDGLIQKQRDTLGQKGDLHKQYGVWEEQLKSLSQDLIVIPGDSSAKVLSVAESSNLLQLARGENREASGLAALQPPHDRREGIGLTAVANSIVDILPLIDPNAAAPATPTDSNSAAPSLGRDAASSAVVTLPVERYDYDLKVSGTYPALVDMINLLVIQKKLVKINKVVISKPEKSDEEQPDAKSFPDYPVKLDMVVSLSLFLYANQSASQ